MALMNSNFWTNDKLVRLTLGELTSLITNLEHSKRTGKKQAITIAAAIRRAHFVLFSVGNLLRKPAAAEQYSDVAGRAIPVPSQYNKLSAEQQESYYTALLALVQANKYLAQLGLSKNKTELLHVLQQTQHATASSVAGRLLSTNAANSSFAQAA